MVDVGHRGLRALAVIAVAVLSVLVAGWGYVRPSLTHLSAPTAPSSSRARPVTPQLLVASFSDAQHGTLQAVTDLNGGPAMYVTSDGGRTWRVVGSEANPVGAVTVVNRRMVLGDSSTNVIVSYDRGITSQLMPDPNSPITGSRFPVFLGSQGWWLGPQALGAQVPGAQAPLPPGLLHTSDGGGTWTLSRASGIVATGVVTHIQFADTSHGFITETLTDNTDLVLSTSDGGITWQPVATLRTSLAGSPPQGIYLLRHGSRLVIWMAAFPDTRGPLPSVESVVSRTFASVSDDGGTSWGPMRPGPVTSGTFGLPPAIDGQGHLWLLEGRHIWTSGDYGGTWVTRVAAMPAGLLPAYVVAAVPGALYAEAFRTTTAPRASGYGPSALLRSSDGGANWTEVQLRLPAG